MKHTSAPRATAALFACLVWTAPTPAVCAGSPAGEHYARVEVPGEPTRYGRVEWDGSRMTLTEPSGEVREVDPSNASRIEFDVPRLVWDAEKPADGALADPWKHGAVGDLPHGGGAEVKSGKFIISTSSPDKEGFDSFYCAYRPLPEGDAQLTAFAARIDTYEEDTRAGVMLRDGTGADARNVFLSVSHRERARVRHWQRQGGTTVSDRRGDVRPGHWLRLVRAGGEVAAYISRDGGSWREVASFKDEFEGQVYACLVAMGDNPRRQWPATFEHVDVTTLAGMGGLRLVEPKFTLADGTVFHSPIESATATLFRLGGDNAGRVLPVATVARVEFFTPIGHDRHHHFAGDRTGVLLANGDFFESKLTAIAEGRLTSGSPLFGKREFDLRGPTDALVLRPAAEEPLAVLPWRAETWTGGKLVGKSIRVEGGELVIDTLRLGEQKIALGDLRRVFKQTP